MKKTVRNEDQMKAGNLYRYRFKIQSKYCYYVFIDFKKKPINEGTWAVIYFLDPSKKAEIPFGYLIGDEMVCHAEY